MSRPMTFDELGVLCQHIAEEHSPAHMGRANGRTVKYIDPHIDFRDFKVFSVTFRGYGWEQLIHTQNECRDLPESLFDRCMTFLDSFEK